MERYGKLKTLVATNILFFSLDNQIDRGETLDNLFLLNLKDDHL